MIDEYLTKWFGVGWKAYFLGLVGAIMQAGVILKWWTQEEATQWEVLVGMLFGVAMRHAMSTHAAEQKKELQKQTEEVKKQTDVLETQTSVLETQNELVEEQTTAIKEKPQ